ncbi:MAG: hypothetical protein H5T86_01285, partial [Armatimonadetes bacterium]|nr:hypothetical protein [Armatimonadota bacterium]
ARAEAIVRRMLSLRPADGRLHIALAEVLAAQGKLGPAIIQAQEAAPGVPVQAARLLARLYAAAGQYDAAMASALQAWLRSRELADCELAAEASAEAGHWTTVRELLAAAPRLTPALRRVAARLALHDGMPLAALKATEGLKASRERFLALLALGRYSEAVVEGFSAPPGEIDETDLATAVVKAAGDENTRRVALAALRSRAAAGRLGPALAEALVTVVAQESGTGGIERVSALSREFPADIELIRAAARYVSEASGPGAAASLAEAAAEVADKAEPVKCSRILAIAAMWWMRAADVPRAVDCLVRAAALRREPALVALLTSAKHTGTFSADAKRAIETLARVWAAPDESLALTEAQAALEVVCALGDRGDAEAWVAAHAKQQGGEITAAHYLLMRSEAEAAIARLAKAEPSPAVSLLRARAMLSAGRPAEALAELRVLIAAGCPEAQELAGDAAAATGDAQEAAWYYARAVALTAGSSAEAKLKQAVRSLSPHDRRLLADLALASLPPEAQSTARAALLNCLGDSETQ